MRDLSPVADPIPALVVSGFLGSGKTTLVRHLLAEAQAHGVRAAVISNEFGELGIDRALLGDTGEAYVELEGGCVCCKLSDELVETLQLLYERVRPDRIIVETSGVAIPYDTQLNFWREPVSEWIGDDLAVVVVNAEQVAAGRELEGLFEDQVSSADLLLLNRIDLVDASELEHVEARLAELAPDVPVVRTERCAVDPALLFAPAPTGARRGERDGTPHDHDAHDVFRVEECALPEGLETAELVAWVRALDALRVKGFASTREGVRVVQGVGPRVEVEEPAAPPPPELLGRVVVIRRA